MSTGPRAIAVSWFRREDYPRIVDLCDDDLFATFDEWERVAQKRYEKFVAQGLSLEKIIVDPGDLEAFAREQGATRIDGLIRSSFAALAMAKKYSRDH